MTASDRPTREDVLYGVEGALREAYEHARLFQGDERPLVRGHAKRVGVFVEFPHRCPGDKCAIRNWIGERER